jgi:hypothetical protein
MSVLVLKVDSLHYLPIHVGIRFIKGFIQGAYAFIQGLYAHGYVYKAPAFAPGKVARAMHTVSLATHCLPRNSSSLMIIDLAHY